MTNKKKETTKDYKILYMWKDIYKSKKVENEPIWTIWTKPKSVWTISK